MEQVSPDIDHEQIQADRDHGDEAQAAADAGAPHFDGIVSLRSAGRKPAREKSAKRVAVMPQCLKRMPGFLFGLALAIGHAANIERDRRCRYRVDLTGAMGELGGDEWSGTRVRIFWASLAVVAAGSVLSPAAPAFAHDAALRAPTEFSAQERQRPRIRVQPQPQPPAWPYPRPDNYSWPAPGPAYRQCEDWYLTEYRPSGTVITPQTRCRWVRGYP
jgi:hypothetical protein